MYYTGIGSRDTPEKFASLIKEIAKSLAQNHYTLRSGGAGGADSFFEEGAKLAQGKMEIYLPWSKFNGRNEKEEGYYFTRDSHYEFYKKAKEIAAQFHPAWDRLKDGSKMLHTRNVHQVLGLDVETPSKFVLCYSEANKGKRGDYVGGTGQALRIATHLRIPIFNLAEAPSILEIWGLDMLRTI